MVKHVQILRVLGSIVLAAAIAGCGGSGSGSGSSAASPYAGNFQGVFVVNSGPDAPNTSTITVNVSNTGVVSASGPFTVGSSTTETYQGAITNAGALSLTETSNNNLTEIGTLTLNSTSHVYTTTLTASNGDVVTVYLTFIPAASTFVGTWTGPEENAGTSTQVSTETATISSTGAISGTDVVTANSDMITQSGFVDGYGNWLIASENPTLGHFVDIGTASISNGALTANYTIYQAGNTTAIGNFTATLAQ